MDTACGQMVAIQRGAMMVHATANNGGGMNDLGSNGLLDVDLGMQR